MKDYFEIQCPGCDTILIVSRKDGVLLETRKPIVENPSGDRFEDAMKKVRGEKEAIEKKFENARKREAEKMERLSHLFKEGLERAKEEGPITKPVNPFDQD